MLQPPAEWLQSNDCVFKRWQNYCVKHGVVYALQNSFSSWIAVHAYTQISRDTAGVGLKDRSYAHCGTHVNGLSRYRKWGLYYIPVWASSFNRVPLKREKWTQDAALNIEEKIISCYLLHSQKPELDQDLDTQTSSVVMNSGLFDCREEQTFSPKTEKLSSVRKTNKQTPQKPFSITASDQGACPSVWSPD